MVTITAINRILDRIDHLEKNITHHFDRLEDRFTAMSYYVSSPEPRLQSFGRVLDSIRIDLWFVEYCFKSVFIISYVMILCVLFLSRH